jgi:hypothetical protein
MSFWLREIVGWLLVLAGLLMCYESYLMLKESRILEVGPLTIIAIVVFRGGIHLLKVAVAARICKEARDRTKVTRPTVAPRRQEQPGNRINPLAVRGS